jgi:ribosomal protein S18 acetylase RimI-like enzyme
LRDIIKTMNIRAAVAGDVESVLPLVEKIVALHAQWDAPRFAAKPDVASMYRGWLKGRCDDATSVFLVAEREGTIVGFLIATTEKNIPIYQLGKYAFIHDVWVEPDYRNEGIARSMTLLALERFKQMGVKQVRLDTANANEIARSMFSQCGFRPTTTEMLCEL